MACQVVESLAVAQQLDELEGEQEMVALLLMLAAARLLLLAAAVVLLLLRRRWAVIAAAELMLLLSCYHCLESPLAYQICQRFFEV